ncbi:MAG: hypothetical protein R3Y19_02135 [Rikenellaceae bacterium]
MLENNRPHLPDDRRSGYRVPEGYFNDLKQTIMTKAQMEEPQESWISALRRIGGFALGFCAMVAISIGIVKLTPDSIEQGVLAQKSVEQSDDLDLFTAMYDVTEFDILDIFYNDEDEYESQLNDGIDDYLLNYGVGDEFLAYEEIDIIFNKTTNYR